MLENRIQTEKLRIAIQTFGCKLNQYESAGLQEELENAGFIVVSPDDFADYYIINTCTVTGKTDRRSRQAARHVLTINPGAGTIMTGCGAQRDWASLAKLPNVIAVLGNREKHQIVDFIYKLQQDRTQICRISDLANAPFERIALTRFRNYSRAFTKIQDGCNRKCSYCVIPSVRGPSRSLDMETVVQDVQRLIDGGYREIVLTGVDLGTYGLDLSPATDLLRLLNMIDSLPSIGRLRLSSIEPMELHPELIEKLTGSNKICRHFHIPLQSGCDRILERMSRTYTRDQYAEKIFKIKRLSPDACIGSDVIVGFPGETDEDFQDTRSFLRDLPIDYLHVFSFSVRDGTPAATFEDHVNPPIIRQRCNDLRSLGYQKACEFRKRMIGKDLPVIILGQKDSVTGFPQALSDNYIRVRMTGSVPEKGSLILAHLEKADKLAMQGFMIDQ